MGSGREAGAAAVKLAYGAGAGAGIGTSASAGGGNAQGNGEIWNPAKWFKNRDLWIALANWTGKMGLWYIFCWLTFTYAIIH